MALDFLQGDDVGVLDLAGDAREIVAVVLAEAVLNVVGDEFHPAAAGSTCAAMFQFAAGSLTCELPTTSS